MRPTFPRYDGPPLPHALDPLNPRHYLMLADWVFFKPSRLKQYLWQADSELYPQAGRAALGRALRVPAYRNLLVTALVLVMAIAVLFAWPVAAIQGTDVDWSEVAFCVVFCVALGVIGGVVVAMVGGVAAGVAAGTAFCVAFGVAGAVLALRGVAPGARVGVVGVMAGVAVNVAGALALGVALGVAGAVTLGAVFGVTLGMVGVLFGLVDMALGVAVGVAGVAFGVAWAVGATRCVFYLFEIGPALWHGFSPGRDVLRHPAITDELAVLPWPGVDAQLAGILARDSPAGMQVARRLLRNPFQRWAVARAYACWLARVNDPLSWLYRMLESPTLMEYIVEPGVKQQFRSWPAARQLWLGEMGGVFVDETGGDNRAAATFAWTVTRRLRGQPDARMGSLARLLLALTDEEQTSLLEVVEGLLPAAVAAVRQLPHGEEVASSLEGTARAVRVSDVAGIAAWRLPDGVSGPGEPALRPTVMEALAGLADVATEAGRYVQATAPGEQAGALNRTVGMLDELAQYVSEIELPERAFLAVAVAGWQRVVAEAAGRSGERALRELTTEDRRRPGGGERKATLWRRPALPFANPYMTSAPVLPPLFTGREDIFSRIRGLWGEKVHPDSVILYGHRRMGKSSILRNLAGHAPAGSLLVVVDLKGETALASSAQSLLRGLADAVVWAAQDRQMNLADPEEMDYATPDAAAHAFTTLVRDVLAKLPKSRGLILALDEFEAVETAAGEGRIGREIYDYLRALSQQPRVTLVLAGLHTLDEMSRDYREAFYDSYVNLRVSYLPPEAAERLITRPSAEFTLNYDRAVVDRIIDETHGQPLLIQRVCQELVHQVNHELFDLERERESRVLLSDLDAVLSDAFVCSETRYFDGVWEAHVVGRPETTAVMLALAEGGPVTAEGVAERSGFTPAQVREELDYLARRDLVEPRGGMWDLCIPLMGRWLRLRGTGTG